MGKLRGLWKSVKGHVDFKVVGNDWISIMFATREDKQVVWENRPYHVQGRLLVLYQWCEEFDAESDDITIADMWLHIPGLPQQFQSFNAIDYILRHYGVGRLVRIDHASTFKNKMRFVPIVVNIDLTRRLVCRVIIRLASGPILPLRVWFEDLSQGCGCCGSMVHSFDDCPLNLPRPRQFQVFMDENPDHEILLPQSMLYAPPSNNNSSSPSNAHKNKKPSFSLSKNHNYVTVPHSSQNTNSVHFDTGGPSNILPHIITPSSVVANAPSIHPQYPNMMYPTVFNPDLFNQFMSMPQAGMINYPMYQDLTMPIPMRPTSPKNLNVTTGPPMAPNPMSEMCTNPVTDQNIMQSPQLSRTAAMEMIPASSAKSINSESTIVKKLDKVDIKDPTGHSSTDSDGVKRKGDIDHKEVSSPATKRPKKKKN